MKPPWPPALDAALQEVRATVEHAADRVLQNLLGASQSATRITERDLLLSSQLLLRQRSAAFISQFAQSLEHRVRDDVSPPTGSRRSLDAADWQTLSLVDDREVESRMHADRLGQRMSQGSEWELRELAGYLGTVLNLARPDEDRNPLRPSLIGAALFSALESLTDEVGARRLLAREFGSALSQLLPACYSAIILDLQQRRIAPVRLSFRGVEGPGKHLTGLNSGYASLHPEEAQSTRSHGADAASSHQGLHAGDTTGSASIHGQRSTSGTVAAASDGGWRRGAAVSAGDAELVTLLRRLTQLASRHGEFDVTPGDGRRLAGAPGLSTGGRNLLNPSASTAASTGGPATRAGDAGEPRSLRDRDADGLMAVNLIRAHREELLQASTGKLDHMVIDVVGSLFDQILSDARVPPQMARQIARLQLPVLRVALVDASFFSSRRHPVRRFVNRIASLACAFDDFSQGPGQQFLQRVSEMVQDIVEGDFEQADLYTVKVAELEAFIGVQTREQLQGNGTAAVLANKESELQTQQRYLLQLKSALTTVAMPDYLRAFLCQVWSQALVTVTRRDGPDADLTQRLRHVGRDLVLSVQPKGAPPMRKRFLMQLPTLMRDLNEGLAMIGWPPSAKQRFMDQLLPSHAESLKGASLSELDYNLLGRQLEAVFSAGITGFDKSVSHPATLDAPPQPDAFVAAHGPADVEQRFTPQEAQQVGLVAESAVDWARLVPAPAAPATLAEREDMAAPGESPSTESPPPTPVPAATAPPATAAVAPSALDMALDIDLDAPAPGPLSGVPVPVPVTAPIAIDLEATSADPAQVLAGAELMAHIRLGFAYQMLLKDEWQKVRLSYVSPGRSFFVFSRGHEHTETISVTARMLARMCETGRMQAVENAYLMERATARARKQLAAMRGG